MTGTPCILIVDDEAALASSIGRLLRALFPRFALDIVVVHDPLSALDVLDRTGAEHRPLMMVSDLNLRADLDGLQLLDEARRIEPHARLVLVSAYPREEIALRPEFAAADAFLPKPFGREELAAVAAPFLAAHALAQGGAR